MDDEFKHETIQLLEEKLYIHHRQDPPVPKEKDSQTWHQKYGPHKRK